MSSHQSELQYQRPEERIYSVAVNKEEMDWKSFLFSLIHEEGLDPWDIDLGVLSKIYLDSIRDLKKVDFDISGKFLTIAVFLLKTKTEYLVEREIRGIEEQIARVEQTDEMGAEELEALDDLNGDLEEVAKKKVFKVKPRNPLARKRKVTIFDLIKTLEKTIEQSNKRRKNVLLRSQEDVKYEGPVYERKKDLKLIIEELYDAITHELGDKKGHITFSTLVEGVEHKMGVLEKFIPLLHLHNHNRLYIKQDKHFGDIHIHKVDGEE